MGRLKPGKRRPNAVHLAQAFGDPGRRSDVYVPDDDEKMHLVWSGMPQPPASRT